MELDVGQATFLAPGEGETLSNTPERTLRILFADDLLDVTWTRHAAGERGAVPHVHHEHLDAFYVLEGAMTLRLGASLEPLTATAGTFVAVPPGIVHGFDNDSATEVRFLNFHAPSGGFADYLRGITPGFDSFDPPADGGLPPGGVTVTPPGGGEALERSHRRHTILAEKEQLSATVMMFEPGWEGVEPHAHTDHVDAFFVLDGEVDFLVARAGAGAFAAAPPQAKHGFRIPDGGGPITLLNIHAPDTGFVSRLRYVA